MPNGGFSNLGRRLLENQPPVPESPFPSPRAFFRDPEAVRLFGAGRSGVDAPAGVFPRTPLTFGLLQGLDELLQLRGRTDPAAFNLDIADIERRAQTGQRAVQAEAARAGLTGSRAFTALGTAVGEAGRERVSRRRAEETRLAEQRFREDLQRIVQLFVDPTLRAQAIRVAARQAKKSGGLGEVGQFLQGAGGTAAGVAQLLPLLGIPCLAAAVIYGPQSKQFHTIRNYMLNQASNETRKAYLSLLSNTKGARPLRALKPTFDRLLSELES